MVYGVKIGSFRFYILMRVIAFIKIKKYIDMSIRVYKGDERDNSNSIV